MVSDSECGGDCLLMVRFQIGEGRVVRALHEQQRRQSVPGILCGGSHLKFGLVYAGAQKNLGPSGVTVVILSPWALARAKENSEAGILPTMLDYTIHTSKGSLFNTPNTFGILF